MFYLASFPCVFLLHSHMTPIYFFLITFLSSVLPYLRYSLLHLRLHHFSSVSFTIHFTIVLIYHPSFPLANLSFGFCFIIPFSVFSIHHQIQFLSPLSSQRLPSLLWCSLSLSPFLVFFHFLLHYPLIMSFIPLIISFILVSSSLSPSLEPHLPQPVFPHLSSQHH